jgi:hypothetical protein
VRSPLPAAFARDQTPSTWPVLASNRHPKKRQVVLNQPCVAIQGVGCAAFRKGKGARLHQQSNGGFPMADSRIQKFDNVTATTQLLVQLCAYTSCVGWNGGAGKSECQGEIGTDTSGETEVRHLQRRGPRSRCHSSIQPQTNTTPQLLARRRQHGGHRRTHPPPMVSGTKERRADRRARRVPQGCERRPARSWQDRCSCGAP